MFDLNRLRTDQLVRLKQVGGDLNQLTDEELTELKESQEEVGDFGAGLMAAESALRTAVAGAAQSFGLESLSQTELTKAKQVEEELGLRYQRDVPSIIEEFEEEGVLGGIAALPEYLKETLAFSLPPTGTALAAGAAGTLLAGPGVGLAAAVTLGTPIFAGNNLKRQMEENDIGLEDTNVMKAFAVGSGQAAFDAVIGRALGFMGPKLPNLNTAAGRQFALANPEKANRALQENIRRVGKAAEQGFTNRFLRKGLQGAGIEAVTETSQQYAEIVQADPDRLFDLTPDQRRELYESAIAGGLLGGTITGTTGAVFKPTKARLEAKQKQLAEFQRLDLDRHLQDETQESIEMERNAELLTGVPKVTPMAEAVNRAFPTDTDVPDPAVVVPEVTRVLQVAGLVTPETHSSIFPNNPAPEFLDIQPKEKPPSISSLDLVINPLTDPEIEQAINELQPQRTPLDTKGLGKKQAKISREGYEVYKRKDPTNTFNVYTVTDGFNSIEFTRDPDQSVGKYNALVINPSKKVSNNPFIGKQRNLGTDNLQQSVDKIIEDWSVGDFVQPRKRPATVAKKKAAMQKIRKKLKEDYGLTDAEAQVILEASPETLKAAQKYSRKRGQTQGQLIRETVKKYASPEKRLQFDAKSTRVRQILADRLKAVGLGDVALRFEQKITPEEDPNIKDIQEGVIEGVTENQGGAVSIALANALYDPNISEAQLTQKLGEVMNHEMIHAIKQLGLITDQEYKILVNAAKQQKFVDRQGVTRSFTYFDRAQRLYPMNDPPKDISETDLEALQQKSRNIQEEEAVAELFRDWAAGRKKMTGKPRNLFQRIADFFRGLGKDIREDPKAENIFKAIESGEIGGRERISPIGEKDAVGESVMYSAKRVMPDNRSEVDLPTREETLSFHNFAPRILDKFLGVGKTESDPDIQEGTRATIRLNLNGRSYLGPLAEQYKAEADAELARIARIPDSEMDVAAKDNARNKVYKDLDAKYADSQTKSFAIQTAHQGNNPSGQVLAYDTAFTVENVEFIVKEDVRAKIQGGLENKSPMAGVSGDVVHGVKKADGVIAKFNPFDKNVHTFYIEIDGAKYPIKGAQSATVFGSKVYVQDPTFFTEEDMPTRTTTVTGKATRGDNKGETVTVELPNEPAFKFFSRRSAKPLAADIAVNTDEEVIELPPNIFGTTKLDKEPPAVDQRLSVKPRIFSTGRIVGAPAGYETESDRTELVNRMVELMEDPFAVIEKSKGWYERSGKQIREITRGDPELMEKVTRLMALYSQANSVGANTTATVKSMYQFATGADTAFAGRFPSTTAARIPALLAAPSFSKDGVGVSDKLENFYRNLIDAATEQDTYADASTQDRWMMRLFGYKVAEDEDVGGASALGDPQYIYAKDIINRVADAYADKTGERLLPRQVQAVLWTYIKNSTDFEKLKTDAKREAFEPKVIDFGDYLTRATANITWESRPSTRLPILSWIHDSRQAQEEFNEAVRTNIFTNPDGTDVIFDMLGASQLYNSDTSIGAYEGKVAPNVVSRLVLDREDGSYLDDIATKAASIIGYVTKQDAVPWYRPDIKGGRLDAVGHKVTFDRDLTPDMEDRLLAHLDKQMPGIGFTKVGTSLQFINFRDENGRPFLMPDKRFLDQKTGEGALIDGLRSFDEDIGFDVESFRAQSEYIGNDWETQPNGEGYIQRYGEGGFGDLQPRIDALAQEYLTLANEFEGRREEFAGRPPTTRRFSRKFSARQREPQRVATPVDVDEIANRFLGAEEETNPLARFWDQNILGRVEGETRWQAFTRNAVNRFLPGYLLDDYVNGEITNPAESVGRNMELAQNMTGRLQAMLELGPLAFNKDTGTVEQIADPKLKGLRDIFAPIGTQLKRPFQTYAIAKRELRLRQEGRVGFSGITEQQAQDTVDQLIDKYPQFEQVHADYQAFNEQMINFAKDSGLLTEEQADSFRNMDYVPFYRLIESATQETNFQQTMSARARAALKDPNVFEKELEGGIDKIGDLYEVVTKNAKFIVSAGLRNYAMDKTGRALELAEQKGGLKSWGRLAKKGETGNIMTLQRDGEEVSYKINDPALWTAVAGLTEIQKQSWIRWLETLGGILRSGVTLMPGFQLANLWRGKVDAYIKTGVPLYRLDQTAAAMRDVYKNDEDVQRFKLISGMGGYLYGGTAESVSKTLERDYRLKEGSGSFFRKVGDQFGRAVVALEKTGEASEMAERLVIQRRLMEQGVNEKEAVFQGLNLINFGRRGAGGSPVMSALVNVLIPSVPFLNARIQGLYRLIEDPNAPGEVKTTAFKEMAGRGMLITAGSVTLAGLAMQDEERWDNETVIEKVTNDIFYVGDTKIRIPKAFEVGALFGTIPVMTIDAIRQETGEDFAQALRHIFLSTFAFNPVPQGVLPILEVVGNYDAFRGAPIEGLSLQRLPDELRAYETTPEIYKFLSQAGLGQFVGLSPLELQQLFEGYTGTMGSSLIAVTDTLASETGVIPERPSGIFGNAFATAAGQITGLNRFLRQDGEGASRFVRDFYELRRDVEQTSAALKQAQGAGLIEEVNDLMEERGKSLGLRPQFNRVARALGKINKQIDAVRISPDLSADQKRDRLNELRKEKIRISAQVVRMAKSSGYFD